MSERKNATNIHSFELSPFGTGTVKKNPAVMNQIFTMVVKQLQDQPVFIGPAAAENKKKTPLPDGTGQIINVGV
jgi:hypothetical protein